MPRTPTAHLRAVPHFYRDRHGTFYFRLTIDGATVKRSLRTKDQSLASMKASALNWQWKMANRPKEPTVSDILKAFKKDGREFDAEFPDGTKLTGINTDDDLRRAKELMIARIEAIGTIEPHFAPMRPEHRPQRSPNRPPKPFSKSVLPYLAECSKDNLNKPKTIADKQATFAAFAEQFGDPDMSSIDKDVAVEFKAKHITSNAGAGRVGPTMIESHAAYLSSWLDALRRDKTEIFRAAADAQRICDYLSERALSAQPSVARQSFGGARSAPKAEGPTDAECEIVQRGAAPR